MLFVMMLIVNLYIGCYKDTGSRDLSGAQMSDNGMTVELCIDWCFFRGRLIDCKRNYFQNTSRLNQKIDLFSRSFGPISVKIGPQSSQAV